MNPFAISGLLAGCSSVAMGLFVLLKNPRHRLNRLWFLFTASVAVWGFGGMWIALEQNERVALMAWRLSFGLGVLWIPILFHHFVTEFCDLKQKKVLRFNYMVGLFFFPVIVFTPYFFGGVRFAFSSFYYSFPGSALFHLFFAWWACLVIYTHFQVFKLYRYASGIRKNQFKYFFIAFVVAYGTGSLDYLPIYGLDLYPYGNFGIAFYPIIITYAIVSYRLMDITVVMSKGLTYAFLLAGVLVPVYFGVTISERATAYAIPPLLAGTLVFASGLWILLKNPRATSNVTFGLLCLSACIWLFSFFMIYSTTDEQAALLWGKFVFAGIVYIPAFFRHFAVSFLQVPGQKRTLWVYYALSTAFLVLLATPFFVHGQYDYYWGYYPKAGILHPLFLAYFAIGGGLALQQLYAGYKRHAATDGEEAKRVKFVFWAFLFGYGSSVDFAQNYGLELYPPGFLFVSLWVLLVTYAIAKYRLLDISFIINRKKIYPYAQGFAIIISFYVATLLLIQLFTGSTQYLLTAFLLAASMVCAELLVGLQKRMERVIGRALFREKHEAYETLSEFSKDMVSILDLNDLNKRFLGTLSRVLSIPRMSLFLVDQERQVYSLASSLGLGADHLNDLRIPVQHPLPRQLGRAKAPLVREELEYASKGGSRDPMIDTLRLMRSDVCLPLLNKDSLIGFCNLGPRTNDQMYSAEDLGLLMTLAQNAAMALDNARLYEYLKRSQVLMQRTDRLRSLETIAGGFAHEIRNPLTSIKTFIQLAPERKDDFEFITGFSKVVNDDVHRIERLIDEILDYARYMRPRLTVEDMNDIISSCLYFVQVKAESLGIRINRSLANDLPNILLDRQQMKQVLLNLLLNALDAMKEFGGVLKVRTERLLKPTGDEWIQVEVSDTGPGIDSANLEHIFDPFYTTKHESGEREGTGLGLAIVHQIVQEHHGTIQVESTVGKGTTFVVNLPVSSKNGEGSLIQEEHEETGPVGR